MPDLSLDTALKIAGLTDVRVKTASADGEPYLFTDRNATIRSYIAAHLKLAGAPAKQKAEEHAAFWGVLQDCRDAMEKISSWRPPELSDQDFAMVQQLSDTQRLQKYAAFDRESVLNSSLALVENRGCYPLSWRKTAAARLLARAERFDLQLPDYASEALHKTAGLGYPTEEAIDQALIPRLNALRPGQEKLGEALSELLDHLREDQELRYDQEFVKSAVDALEQYDAQLGLNDHYGQGIPLPEELLGASTHTIEKLAGAKLAVELVNGHTLAVDKISKEALAAVDPRLAALGQEELADVLPTLPRGDADLLVRVV